MRAASTRARRARSSAPSSARSSCRRTSATAAATACRPARSASSTGATCRAAPTTRRSRCRCSARKEDGRVWKCTLCYDRLKGGHEPACAKACPTNSIQFGELDELRERAQARLATLEEQGWNGPRLYGEDPDDGVGGFGAFFLLLDEPEVYGLPPDPVAPSKHLPQLWRTTALAAAAMFVGLAATFLGGRRVTESQSYYGRPILKEPTWTPEVPAYLFTGGIAGGCAVLHGFARADAERRPRPGGASRRRCDGDRVADPPDLRPRAARAVPEHAAGLQGHLADERRQLDPRRLRRHRQRRRRARGDRHPAAAEVARGARLVRDRAAARDVHGRAAREHRDPRVERGARRAAVRLRLERLRERRRGGGDLHDARVGGTSPPRRGRSAPRSSSASCTRWRSGSASSARSTGRARPASTRRSRRASSPREPGCSRSAAAAAAPQPSRAARSCSRESWRSAGRSSKRASSLRATRSTPSCRRRRARRSARLRPRA